MKVYNNNNYPSLFSYLQNYIMSYTTPLNFYIPNLLDNQLYHIQEHLHWLILISAHVLADPGAGEQPMIPDSLMQLSSSQVRKRGMNEIWMK